MSSVVVVLYFDRVVPPPIEQLELATPYYWLRVLLLSLKLKLYTIWYKCKYKLINNKNSQANYNYYFTRTTLVITILLFKIQS